MGSIVAALKLWKPALFVLAGPSAAVAALTTLGMPWWQAIGTGVFVSVAAGLALFTIEIGSVPRP